MYEYEVWLQTQSSGPASAFHGHKFCPAPLEVQLWVGREELSCKILWK